MALYSNAPSGSAVTISFLFATYDTLHNFLSIFRVVLEPPQEDLEVRQEDMAAPHRVDLEVPLVDLEVLLVDLEVLPLVDLVAPRPVDLAGHLVLPTCPAVAMVPQPVVLMVPRPAASAVRREALAARQEDSSAHLEALAARLEALAARPQAMVAHLEALAARPAASAAHLAMVPHPVVLMVPRLAGTELLPVDMGAPHLVALGARLDTGLPRAATHSLPPMVRTEDRPLLPVVQTPSASSAM